MKGLEGGMLFVLINFAAANLPFHPRARLVSAFVYFSCSSGGGKPVREVTARSFLAI